MGDGGRKEGGGGMHARALGVRGRGEGEDGRIDAGLGRTKLKGRARRMQDAWTRDHTDLAARSA